MDAINRPTLGIEVSPASAEEGAGLFMPHRLFNVDEVAAYLHLSRADIERFLKNQEIPSEARGDRVVFRKREIDAWASQRILGLGARPLTEYHQKSSHGTQEILPHAALIPQMIQPDFIVPALASKTKSSVLRDLVDVADRTGRVFGKKDLLTSLEEREELCPTALPGGLALPHPRHHDEYLFDSSFIVLGRAIQEIHFGAPDGKPTDLFFLMCCQDDRLHLHTLARLCMMALKTELLSQLRAATEAPAMYAALVACEQEVLAARKL